MEQGGEYDGTKEVSGSSPRRDHSGQVDAQAVNGGGVISPVSADTGKKTAREPVALGVGSVLRYVLNQGRAGRRASGMTK